LAIEFLIFAALSLEAQIKLNQAKYLSWRVRPRPPPSTPPPPPPPARASRPMAATPPAAAQVRLYAAICHAYDSAKLPEGAQLWAARGLEQVKRLAAAEARDPVPPPAEIRRSLAAAALQMQAQVARHAAGEPGDALLGALRDAAAGDERALVGAACRALEDPARRTLRHAEASPEELHRSQVRRGAGAVRRKRRVGAAAAARRESGRVWQGVPPPLSDCMPKCAPVPASMLTPREAGPCSRLCLSSERGGSGQRTGQGLARAGPCSRPC
jgi:hypothetical protein